MLLIDKDSQDNSAIQNSNVEDTNHLSVYKEIRSQKQSKSTII